MWDTIQPLKEIEDENIREIFLEEAKTLLNDLETNRLEVTLYPARRQMHSGHCVRARINSNPEWYKNLWRDHSYHHKKRKWGRYDEKTKSIIYKKAKRKKPDSTLKRERCIKALEKIINYKDHPLEKGSNLKQSEYKYTYQTMFRNLIFERLTQGYEEMNCYIPQNEEVCNYFGVKIRKKKIKKEKYEKNKNEPKSEKKIRDEDGFDWVTGKFIK